MRAILTYHSIDDTGSVISVAPAEFRAHVRFLASGRIRVVPLAGMLLEDDGRDAVAITFDDGFANFESEALPVLIDHGLTATVFAVTDRVGETNDWDSAGRSIPRLSLMTWQRLGRLSEVGMEIGAHSRRHRDVTVLSPAEAEDEIAGSGDQIFRELGLRPTAFAYPFGRFGAAAGQLAGEHYECACTTELRFLDSTERRTRLPRVDMYYLRNAAQLEAWGRNGFRRRLWLRAQGRRVRDFARRVGAV
jgi:peptidoglycan/xylan/chitin deacetylase (PgdA/CDA1 family)